MGIQLRTNSKNLDLGVPRTQIIEGIDGGYYTPSVDNNGILTWVPSQEDMEPVAEANIKGPKGDDGAKGDKGAKGDTGDAFTYDMFTEEQLEALTGPAGADGAQGPKGDKGDPGVNGTNGRDGVDGVDGESGVYVGTTEPTDDEMLIWINPEGTATQGLATIEYVNNAIAASLVEVENGSY